MLLSSSRMQWKPRWEGKAHTAEELPKARLPHGGSEPLHALDEVEHSDREGFSSACFAMLFIRIRGGSLQCQCLMFKLQSSCAI